MKALGRILSWAVAASTMFGAACVVLMMLQIVADVLLKNIFAWPIPATSVIVSHYYMVAVAYIPIALSEKLNGHIAVEVLFRRFGQQWQRFLMGCIWLVSAIVAGGITHRLWFEAMKKFSVEANVLEAGLKIYTWPSHFILPVGFGLFCLVLLYRFVLSVTGLTSGLGETAFDADTAEIAIARETSRDNA
ncbi:MAG: TRAP transporter small permease [Pseudomonadota bacterium]|nr:TRAP transporter small permease [Pseudomonadota bacterium]